MINFWRYHWLWCCCVLHSSVLVAGDEETVPLYKKMLSDARESVKFSDPKYSHILRGTETDLRRTGSDIVKKSNDHLEKQTAPNRVSRVLPASESNRSAEEEEQEEVAFPKNLQNISNSDNASRNARDLSYDAVPATDTVALAQSDGNVSHKNVVPLRNDSVYSTDTESGSQNKTYSNDTNGKGVDPSVTPATTTTTTTTTTSSTIITSATSPTLSTLILKNPKDKENKTKLDFNSTSAKKAAVNAKVKNASSTENVEKAKISGVLLLNDSRYDNSSDYVSDQWSFNETSHNYNVTVTAEDTSSKNITLLTAAAAAAASSSSASVASGEEETNETKIAATSRRTMQESPPLSTLNIALITVAAFAVVSAVSVIGMVSVVLYRRYHWNKPQTLSDKCSNADSTGYIDDSTLKENSEEMYSLDNDSFLNSLEAMTIQNYWADSIRHTKL